MHQLLRLDDLSGFLDSTDFDRMLIKVAQDDVVGYKSGNEWLAHHPAEAILFKEPDKTWAQIKEIYSTSFSDMVFGTLPPEEDILKTIHRIAKRLQTVEWTIKPSNQTE